MIPPAVSIGIAVAIFGIVALTLQHLRLERDLALSAAAREVDMRATLLAQRLNAALGADPQGPRPKSSAAFSRLIPTSGSPNRSSSTATGALVEFDRTQAASNSPLAALVGGPKRAAAAGGDWGGVIKFQTERGDEQFAAVRALPRTSTRWPSPRRSIFISPPGAARRW